MKPVRKGFMPTALLRFSAAQPSADWEVLRGDRPAYKAIKKQLAQDQRYLCAYCEINLLIAADSDNEAIGDDFRVEHFHPKLPHQPPPNWALDWQNMLGVCHGGSSKEVREPARFQPSDPSCDVPKADKDLTGTVFNPLTDIPPLESIFSFKTGGLTRGQISVSVRCPENLKLKAAQSIAELKLNAKRLVLQRAETIDRINQHISVAVENGDATQLPSAYFDLSSDNWPAFPTLIRFLLGPVADQYLSQHHYTG